MIAERTAQDAEAAVAGFRTEAAAQSDEYQRRMLEVEAQAMASVHAARTQEILFAESGRNELISEARLMETEAKAYVSFNIEHRRAELERAALQYETQARSLCEPRDNPQMVRGS